MACDALSTDARRGLRWAEHYVDGTSSSYRRWSSSNYIHQLTTARDEAYPEKVSMGSLEAPGTSENELANGEVFAHSSKDAHQETPNMVTENESEPEVKLRPRKRRFSSPEASSEGTDEKPLKKRLALGV